MNISVKDKIIFLMGPTASGKTDLAIEAVLATGFNEATGEYNGEIVGADSRQIFNDFNLTTGKATEAELTQTPSPLCGASPREASKSNTLDKGPSLGEGAQGAKGVKIIHHLINTIDAGTYFSVEDYKKLAIPLVFDILKRGKVPIICGGTGQYIDAIYFDEELSPVPADQKFRDLYNVKTHEELFELIKAKDERTANKIDKNNKVRLVRALEIIEALGKVPETVKKERFDKNIFDIQIINTSRKFDRDTLRERIAKRLEQRLEQGMVEEVRAAKEKYRLSSTYLNGLGLEFKNINKFLDGEINYEEMIKNLVLEIGQYAKRQETWFRKYENVK